MKKTILLTLIASVLAIGSSMAQYVVKDTFFETTGVSNGGVVAGYEAQAGPYSLWNADTNTFEQIGGLAPGQGIGGKAIFSNDGTKLSGTSNITVTSTTEWEKLNTGFNYIFRGIEFPEGQNYQGYAAGESLTSNGDGIVIVTYDSGDSWNELWTGTNQGLEAMSFPDLNTGYVGGWNEYFAKTTDGGYNWTQQSPGTDVYIYTSIVFKDVLNGVVTAQTNTGVAVYTTSDGGDTWTTGSGLVGVPYKLTYVSGDTYFLVTNGGDIQKSTDNGLTWASVFSGGGLLLGIEFYDANIGIATAENDVFKTTDGGATWVGYEVIEGALWRDVAWLDQDNVTLVGTPELIFSSEDGGDTWPINNLDTSTLNEALYEVLFTPNGTGYIIGSQGVMFRKTPETNDFAIMSRYDTTTEEWTTLGSLGFPLDNTLSGGYNISGDGTMVIGNSWAEPAPGTSGLGAHAVAWTEATGIIDLGTLYPDVNRSTRAEAVSDDGNVIVGWQDFNGPWKSAVWRKDANGDFLPNEYLLLDPAGDPTDEFNQLGECSAISGDGIVIGGRGDYANNYEPWIWTEAEGYTSLGTLAPNGTGSITGMNHDGSIIIGYFQIGPWDPNVPFIWTTIGGLQDFHTFISDVLGYDIGEGHIYAPNSISSNGEFVTGWGFDPTIGQFGELYTFRLQLPTVPLNNSCTDAEALNCGDLVTNSTIFGTDSGGNASPDVYYSYTGSGSAETITLNACGDDTTFPTTVRVYSDCTLSTQIAFNDSSCVNQPELEFESDGTSTYVIMVEGYSSTDAGSFQLELTCEPIILGVGSFNQSNIVLSPNPVQNVLQLSSQFEVDNILIYSVTGSEVLSQEIKSTNAEIDFSSLSDGVYFVKTISGDAIDTFKIIKN
ncbi:YCF48-related protein [Ulvibacter antarcticus]|uniref:Putative secreted protein (Por secretion system target) n=1 Tax=Ulvibacter antarcticus TaxID=442714 RepID=A0A3L9YB37_9FLAO|nr:YCF48-related protein [Ulvibacter antarcticus]RMA57946.1 putative secreted protein (Por secretion system target) [Ulvibacter antarcticus]